MYSGSVSARQSTNHNSGYRMLMDTRKFLSNLVKHIPRSSNPTCTHTNPWTSTWPQDTPLFLSGAVPTSPLPREMQMLQCLLCFLQPLCMGQERTPGRSRCAPGDPAHTSLRAHIFHLEIPPLHPVLFAKEGFAGSGAGSVYTGRAAMTPDLNFTDFL